MNFIFCQQGPINPDSVPGSTLIPTWALLAAIAGLYAVDLWRRAKLEDRVISLAERVVAAVEALEEHKRP